MPEIIFEDDKFKVSMEKDNWQVTVHFKISRAVYPNENGAIALSYQEWNSLMAVIQRTKKYFNNFLPPSIHEGNVNVHWLTDRYLELTVGEHFDEYFNLGAYAEFANLVEKANGKIIERQKGPLF